MANLGVPAEVTEYQDPPEVLQKKIRQLAGLIKQSKYVVAYTGAGISTSTGIPDFRGPQGVWTLREQGKQASRKQSDPVRPSLAHMALVQLQNWGILKYLVSQNTDGLHRRSGIRKSNLAELHGNTNIELCRNCGREYWRPFSTREAYKVHDHRTSRKCDDKCRQQLQDTIINFGESLPSETLAHAMEHSQKADLGIVLGTSMRVFPAADLPLSIVRRGKALAVVNLQKTPVDHLAAVRIFGKTDEVMEGVMIKLGDDIPVTCDLLDQSKELQPRSCCQERYRISVASWLESESSVEKGLITRWWIERTLDHLSRGIQSYSIGGSGSWNNEKILLTSGGCNKTPGCSR